jgi:cell wall-associated NlpC family hydrolase
MAIQDAVKIIKTACTQWSLGYDQTNRLDFRDGGETDCSALVILICEQAGLLPGNDIRKNIGATFTGNMRANFKARGWRVLPTPPKTKLQPGDVLLNDADHTAMYVGNGKLAQASIDETDKGVKGGASGDQTGRETQVLSYYNFPWSCVLRYHVPITILEDSMLLNKGQDAITPIALPNDIKVVRFYSDQPARLTVDTREKDKPVIKLNLTGGLAPVVQVPDNIHAFIAHRLDAGTNDISIAFGA